MECRIEFGEFAIIMSRPRLCRPSSEPLELWHQFRCFPPVLCEPKGVETRLHDFQANFVAATQLQRAPESSERIFRPSHLDAFLRAIAKNMARSQVIPRKTPVFRAIPKERAFNRRGTLVLQEFCTRCMQCSPHGNRSVSGYGLR